MKDEKRQPGVEKKPAGKRYVYNVLTILLFGVILFCVPATYIVGKDRNFSPLENRNLQQKPNFTKENFYSGEFQEELEVYLADQFPQRDLVIQAKSYMELALCKKESNGVFRGKDNQLFQDFKKPDLKLLRRNITYINKFSKKFETFLLIAPTATSVYKEKLPAFAKPYGETAYLKKMESYLGTRAENVNIFKILQKHKKEYIYYKTDHHWTSLGAYYAYTGLCKTMGIKALPLSDYEPRITKNFYGSLYSMGNYTFVKPDTLTIYEKKKASRLRVEYVAEGEVTDTLYAEKYLKKKDKYSVFLDGNHPLIKITTDAGNGKKLAVIKDSYANSLIPFLTSHYEEILVIDLRFFNGSIAPLLEGEGIKQALILYNVQNFAKTTSFSLLAS